MSAVISEMPTWLADSFWVQLDKLEARCLQMQSEYEGARRALDAAAAGAAELELRDTWTRYCSVIAELEKTSEEIATLRLPSL